MLILKDAITRPPPKPNGAKNNKTFGMRGKWGAKSRKLSKSAKFLGRHSKNARRSPKALRNKKNANFLPK